MRRKIRNVAFEAACFAIAAGCIAVMVYLVIAMLESAF